ncbi:DNA primase [Dactylosporangium sp. NPDC000521]|uniref:DNA primase n=1 Tax=Dactylosporangium sp. NPDC000521 TaxID=3363975 RepID=UPI0036984743
MARQSSRPSSSRPASSRPAAAKKSTPAPAVTEPEVADTTETADVIDDADAVEALEAAEDDEVEALSDEADDLDESDADLDEEEGGKERSAQADAMWEDVNVQPVEIALPKGVGYTLRAYRLSTELTPTEVDEEEDDFAILHRREADVDEDEVIILDEHAELFAEEEPAPAALDKKLDKKKAKGDSDSDDEDDVLAKDKSDDSDEDSDEDEDEDEAGEADVIADEASEEEDEDEEEPEEVPAFLGHRGKLLLFRSVEGLVEFVKSDAEHDLCQLDTWSSLKTRITASSVVPKDEDRYELDLVVENLRGGQDAWDADLLIAAGEVARDLAYSLRLEPVRTALAPGSPLDDLDEALRAAEGGGVSGFFAKRRLKKIGAQQAALGWRTIIGKISAATDWRD